MQLYAVSDHGERVMAARALPHVDYRCPECQGIVRVRKGQERIPHFFHRNEGSSCRMRMKEGLHHAVQSWLVNACGPSTCTVECAFPEICRVADVAYHPKRTVFEIQVSPLSADEALHRTLAYWHCGWHVIWLLHAQTFGRHRASAFEQALLPIPHYFTTIGLAGGSVWDEVSVVRGRYRYWYLLPPQRRFVRTVDLAILRSPSTEISSIDVPRTGAEWQAYRRQHWSCHIEGDWLLEPVPDGSASVMPKTGIWWREASMYLRLLWLRFFG